MEYSDFESELDKLRASGGSRREITRLLEGFNTGNSSEFIRKYVHEHLTVNSSHRFLSSLVAASGVALERADVLRLTEYLKAESRSEESDLYAALRTAVADDTELVSLLLQTFIIDARETEIQPDLLFVFPEAKVHYPELFLECVKTCAELESKHMSFTGVISSVLCDLPPDEDENTARYVSSALRVFGDTEWLRQVEDHTVCEITGGLFALASILLDRELIESVLRFTLASLEQREPSNAVVRVLATPYTMWTDETEELMPGLESVYENQLRNVAPGAPILTACHQFRTMIFEDRKHLQVKVNARVRRRQIWRKYRRVRTGTEG